MPATRIRHLTDRVKDDLLAERARGPFVSLADFYSRVRPSREELEVLLRAGALDTFGESRTGTFWRIQWLVQRFDPSDAQGSLFAHPEGIPCLFDRAHDEPLEGGRPVRRALSTAPPDNPRLGPASPSTPDPAQRLKDEMELLGFPVSGDPLDLYPDIAWDTYCPVAELGNHIGRDCANQRINVLSRAGELQTC